MFYFQYLCSQHVHVRHWDICFENNYRKLYFYNSECFTTNLEDEMGRRQRAGKTVELQPWDM